MALGGLNLGGNFKQKALVMAMMLGGGSYVFYTYYISPIRVQIQGQQNRIRKLRQEVQKGKQIEKRIPVFKQQIKNQREKLANFRRTLPSEKETPELMRQIQAKARDNQLLIRSFKSKRTVKRDFYEDWPIDIWVEGSYHNLATFFQSIGELARLVNISNLAIRAVDGGTNRQKTITATCTATTFVFLRGGTMKFAESRFRNPRTSGKHREPWLVRSSTSTIMILLLLSITAVGAPWQKPNSGKSGRTATAKVKKGQAGAKVEAEATPLAKYTAISKRDPFQNLASLKVRPSAPKIIAPPLLSRRPPGLPGLLISEVSIIGMANKGAKKIVILPWHRQVHLHGERRNKTV